MYLIIAKTDSDALTEEMIKKGERKRCPFCVNIIHAQAIKCSFCSSDVEEKPELAEQETSREGKEGEEESDGGFEIIGLLFLLVESVFFEFAHAKDVAKFILSIS